MGRGRFHAAGALLVAAAAWVVPAPATAAPTWLAPVPLDVAAAGPAVGTGARGDSAAVWIDADGRVVVAARARAAFGTPQILGQGAEPAVGVADDGTVLAAWAEGSGVAYAVRRPGGAFGAPALLADGGSGTPSDIRVVLNRLGEALVAYSRDRAYATVGPAEGPLPAPRAVSPGSACGLRADLADGGHGAVAWHSCSGGAAGVARRTPGRPFETAALGTAGAVAVAVEDTGTTLVALAQDGVIRVAEAAVGGDFSAPAQVSAEPPDEAPALAAGGGEVWAVWRQGATNAVVAAARRPPGGAFRDAGVTSAGGVTGAPLLAAGAEGTFVAAWLRDTGGSGIVAEAAHRAPAAGRFAPAAPISASGADAENLALAADGDGNALAGHRSEGRALVRALDAAGPQLLGIEAPAVGYAKRPYPFAFVPVDAWSALADARIDFGDGTTVGGRRAEHAYATAGAKTVTFSARDAVGNATAVRRSFQAAPPPDRTRPVIRKARLDRRRFRVSGKPTPIAAAVRRGTRFRYRLSERAQVTIFFERIRAGRRRGGTCERGRRRGKRCKAYEPIGLITRTHPVAGKVSTAFTGRIVGYQGTLKIADIRLRPGRYRARLVAADEARNVSRPVKLRFTVLR